jgi:hypothetical protein
VETVGRAAEETVCSIVIRSPQQDVELILLTGLLALMYKTLLQYVNGRAHLGEVDLDLRILLITEFEEDAKFNWLTI